jgi:hypothetical protein
MITVTSTADAGPGSLRDAIAQANADTEARAEIRIATNGTIALESPLPELTKGVSIMGPGADELTIRPAAPHAHAIFRFAQDAFVTRVTLAAASDAVVGASDVQIHTCTISDSSGTAITAGQGRVTVWRSTLARNATALGVRGSEAYVGTSTFSGNGTDVVAEQGSIKIESATFAESTTALRFDKTIAVSVNNTVVAGGSCVVPDDIVSYVTSGNNVSSDASCRFNMPNTNAMLRPLADNGGTTWTHAPAPGSPLINAGLGPVMNPWDQRERPLSADHIDIGAFEVQFRFLGDVLVSVGDGTISVTPGGLASNDGDGPFLGYAITCDAKMVKTAGETVTFSGLANNTEYWCSAAALSEYGPGPARTFTVIPVATPVGGSGLEPPQEMTTEPAPFIDSGFDQADGCTAGGRRLAGEVELIVFALAFAAATARTRRVRR